MYNTIYPNYVGTYTGIRTNQQRRQQVDDEKTSQSSQQAENDAQQASKGRNNDRQDAYFPNGEKVSIDYSRRQIGIEQVLKDFRNTANAIGTPDEIKKEVGQYLSIIETQAQKEVPNSQLIQANLKTASQILDQYITKTLKKPSNVVENWVDALFLQKIDYKMQAIEAAQVEQPQTLTEAETSAESPVKNEEQNGIYVPSDAMLKRLFLQAKKYSLTDKTEQALYAFQTAMDYAQEIGDLQSCAMIHFEQAKLYDGKNQLNEALANYNSAIQKTSDNNIKAKAHLNMGKIYDDYIKFAPAVDHYCAAVSYSGESDNLPLQSKALSDLAQIHAERYDKSNSISFMTMADTIADETKNSRIKGFISAKNAQSCETLNEKARALNYHGKAAGAFNEEDDKENLARQYQAAAKIMMTYGNFAKAKSLLSKAFVAAQATDNMMLKSQISSQIANI
ncbi:hypothetical protein II906_01870 [bacterium]|nr:hypothetical protein [bacterium]